MYKIVAGHEWYLQVLYVIGSADGRMRRHAEMVTVSDYVERKRRAVAGGDEYLQTLFSSHSAQNGTNMHGLQLGKSCFFIKGSPNPSHLFFEINVGNRWIRHRTTLHFNDRHIKSILNRRRYELHSKVKVVLWRIFDFKNEMESEIN